MKARIEMQMTTITDLKAKEMARTQQVSYMEDQIKIADKAKNEAQASVKDLE